MRRELPLAWKEVIRTPAEMSTKEERRTSQAPLRTAARARGGLRGAGHRFWTDPRGRCWLVAWVGAPVLAIVNGAARELAYKDHVGESAANYDVTAGNIWILILLWITAGPTAVRAIAGEPR